MSYQRPMQVAAMLARRVTGMLAFNRLRLLFLVPTMMLSSCGASGSYVWVDDVVDLPTNPTQETTIQVGDLVSVRVFGQDAMSARERVRRDGAFSLPLVGDLMVAQRSPADVAHDIELRIKPFINEPHVTVVIEESRTRVAALGEVSRPGIVDLDGPQGILEVLALSGGLTQFASDRIFVLRQTPSGMQRIRFDYGRIVKGEGRAATFKIRNGDKLIVE